jgi:beta-1,4-mannosyl-glycoprotein beta-1,4-N-acetylglucosaminyltransferase
MNEKIFDCITFFQENFITNIRFEILKDVVDYFVVCESIYDHRGKKKRLNFKLLNDKIKSKIIYLVSEDKFDSKNIWKNQAKQREFIFNGLKVAKDEDYIMFSDPDEIPRPEKLTNLNLKSKFGIFLQNCYCYKFNIFNRYESPWEGTRICKKKHLKSIDHLRQNIKSKNLKKPIWKFYIEKNIELISDGGWHFNSIIKPDEISLKLKTFAHHEYSSEEYTNIKTIKENILNKKDLFKRGNNYQSVTLDTTFPKYILENKQKLNEWID